MFKQLKDVDPKLVVALDIETCREYKNITDAPEDVQLAFKYFVKNEGVPEEDLRELQFLYEQKAAFKAEFSSIVSISVSFLSKDGTKLLVQNWTGDNELEILSALNELLDRVYKSNPKYQIAAHYQLFDLPFICKRNIINGIPPHTLLDNSNSKPWLISTICTHSFWKMGGTASASLSAICSALKLPSPKNLMCGEDVAERYFAKDYEAIANYCNADTISVFWIIQKWKGLPITEAFHIPTTLSNEASDAQAVAALPLNNGGAIPETIVPEAVTSSYILDQEAAVLAQFEAQPCLNQLYITKDFSDEVQDEIRDRFLNRSKKVQKREWPMLERMLCDLYVNSKIMESDTKPVKEGKIQEVKEFIEQLQKDYKNL